MRPLRKIPQRELRNHSGEILRETEKGEQFLITVEGRPVALLSPYPKRQWVPKADVLELLRTARPDPTFFADVAELGDLADLSDPWPPLNLSAAPPVPGRPCPCPSAPSGR